MMDSVGNLVVISDATGTNDVWRGLWTINRRQPSHDQRHIAMDLVEEGGTEDTFDDRSVAAEAGRQAGIARAREIAAT
jgi:hypothetical protein